MGKKDKKKKGHGMEKTMAKTEKNLSKKLKKQVNKKEEEHVDQMVTRLMAAAAQSRELTEQVTEPPPPRTSVTLCAHPERDELLLYGGEYYNGRHTTVYGDLYQYRCGGGGQWRRLQYPAGPPPRCGHAAAVAPLGGGQLWLSGGEFSSPSGEQFYHYRDLWCLHIAGKRWEKISVAGGPTARSGHRMVYCQKQLLVFGGFHDNLQSFQYFNDVHAFDVEKREWRQLDVTGQGPSPRSGVIMLALSDGRVLVYGGYCKQKVKKNTEQGTTFGDMYLLAPDKHDSTRWRWSSVKQGGARPSLRSGMAACCHRGDAVLFFGGVTDDETDDALSGTFFNDMFVFDTVRCSWRPVTLSGRRDPAHRRRRRRAADPAADPTADPTADPAADQLQAMSLNEAAAAAPSPRARAGLTSRAGQLYLYGGQLEQGDREITLSDMYQLDTSKMDEWRTLVEQPTELDWQGSDDEMDSADDEEEEENGDDDDDDSDMEDDEDL